MCLLGLEQFVCPLLQGLSHACPLISLLFLGSNSVSLFCCRSVFLYCYTPKATLCPHLSRQSSHLFLFLLYFKKTNTDLENIYCWEILEFIS